MGSSVERAGPAAAGPALAAAARRATRPAPQPAKAGDEAEAATAKTESCFSTSGLWQEGHETASPKRRTSFSKRLPQPGQAYS